MTIRNNETWYEATGPLAFHEPYTSMSGGPERIVGDDPDPKFLRAPVGFTAPILAPADASNAMPLLWEGDDS